MKHINIQHNYKQEQYQNKVINLSMSLGITQLICSPSPCQLSKWRNLGP